MYHAIPSKAGAASGADAHYSVELPRFRTHLDLMQELGLRACSVRDLLEAPSHWGAAAPIALTFDDGHASNFAAFAEIARHGGSADLFVNPSTIGTPGFLSWAQLRELAAHGASIQSHGQHHVFLDELPEQQVRSELVQSRERIAAELGRAAELFAPPNGRMPPDFLALATDAGYRAVCSSRVGLWSSAAQREIPRFAVLARTSDTQMLAWLRRDPRAMALGKARAALLFGAKRLLGNAGYAQLRGSLLRWTSGGRS
jgi:peptidoglycan/xylan/chitin deacetylase (PgdA/CDA1 family)